MLSFRTCAGIAAVLGAALLSQAAAPRIKWVHLSSKKGELPVPGESTEQTGALVAKLDPNGATDFLISFRKVAPALAWYRHGPNGWTRYVVEKEFLRVEAGGAAYDIDGDGDLDIVFGGDGQANRLWWWENPYPHFDPGVSWKRHIIKDGGANQHHDQIFADLKGTGKPQLVFWNQKAKTLFFADIPKDPRTSGPWKLETIYSGQAGEGVENAAAYAEGVDAFDVDGDGRVDLLAGNYWFKHLGGGQFKPIRIGSIGGRIKAGKFKPGRYAQVVIAPGDGSGPLKFYECKGDPTRAESWVGRDLLGREMTHGHTLDVGDVNGDGHLDIFAAEMAKWGNVPAPQNPAATAWILYGDGKGAFEKMVFRTGDGWHEGKLADLDGDGDIDILNKPYTWETPRVDVWLNNGTNPKRPMERQKVGMELWTYRTQLKADLPATLATIRSLGFTDIETASFYDRSAAEFRKILDAAGLTCSSIITGYDRLKSDLPAVIADAKAVGAKYVLTAGIPRKGRLTAEDVHRAAADFNAWGAKLKAAGLRLGYHPHGFEFVPDGAGNLFDTMLAETEPGLVTYEMDVFWFVHGGADPVKYLTKHPGRFSLVHLKDMAKGAPTGLLTGKASNETSVALGTGTLDWRAIFAAAKKAGVKQFYIEDESPAAPAQVLESIKYLKSIDK